MKSHYLELGHNLYALCGAAIMKSEHSLDPTCPACRAAIQALNAETAEDRFGGEEIVAVRQIGGRHAGRT